MTKRFIYIFAGLLFLLGCNDKKESNVVFVKEQPAKEDAIKTWLRQNENYANSKNYLLVFNTYYNKKISEKNYLDAAKILDVVSLKLAYFYDFNDEFIAAINEFDVKYRQELPALKTTFVDSYLANYYYDRGDFKKACDYFKNITSLEPNDYKSCFKIARANYELSYVYFNMGKQDLSLQANEKALEYFTKIGDIDGLGSVYSNYANIYKAIGDQKRAIENADKAIKAFKSINNTYDTYMGLYNKISVYDYVKDPRRPPLIDSTYQAFLDSKFENNVLLIGFSDMKVEILIDENKLVEAKKILDDIKPVVEKVNSDNWTQDYNATLGTI